MMNQILRLFLLALLGYCTLPGQLNAQDKSEQKRERKTARKARRSATEHFLQLGGTATRVHFSDANISTQLYGGWGIGAVAAWHTYFPKAYIRVQATYSNTYVSALTAGPGGAVIGITGNSLYAFKLKSWRDGRIQPYLGPSLASFYRDRTVNIENSSFNDDLAFNLGVVGHLKADFKLFNKSAFATYTLNIPVFTYLESNPLFGVYGFGVFERTAPVGIINQATSELALAGQIGRAGNLLQISYSWDYYAYTKESNPMRLAQHGISLSLMFRL